MRAQVKRLHTPDADSLASFVPEREDDFSLLVQIMVGPEDDEGEESFDLEVVTPKELARRVARTGPICGRHYLIVNRFDPHQIQLWIEKAVSSCAGRNWEEITRKLSRIGRWEFEDYVEG